MAVGGDLAWYAEIEPAACQVLEAHYPNVPNLGDITEVGWSQVEPVDIITGGYPCQPFSHAGSRKGKDDERHLWPYVRDAIYALRPRYAILENVSGHLTLGLADVLSDLTEIGFNAEWGTYRASDIGAPHRRERVFIIAYASDLRRESRANDSRSAIYTVERYHAHTPDTDHANGKQEISGLRPVTAAHVKWGKYEPAVRRWERLTRPAPDPTYQRAGRQRLNPAFVEWMMGLPEGHVTGHGLSTAKQLKMLGNGVVPQQAAAAISQLMERTA